MLQHFFSKIPKSASMGHKAIKVSTKMTQHPLLNLNNWLLTGYSYSNITKPKKTYIREAPIEADEVLDQGEYFDADNDQVIVEEDDDSDSILNRQPQYQEEKHSKVEKCEAIESENGDILIKTSYGLFKIFGSNLQNKHINKINSIYYINNSSKINFIYKVLKNDPHSLIVFEPSTYYYNFNLLYDGIRKRLIKQHFGTLKQPSNPFKKCKTNKETFNLNRRIRAQINFQLSKICIISSYDGTLRLQGKVPFSETLQQMLSNERTQTEEGKVGFYKYHYFIPGNYFQGLNSSDQWSKQGISIDYFGGRKIYPLHSVWAPTNQHYLQVFYDYLNNNQKKLQARSYVLDIGCGSGILGLLYSKIIGTKTVYAIDSNIKAVESTRLNAQVLDMLGRVNAQHLDLQKFINEKQSNKALEELTLSPWYEVMICNPPWIIASKTTENELENGIYDPEEKYLKSVFQFANKYLTREAKISKDGILLLYYSNLSQLLGLQSENRIEELCQQNKLTISNVQEIPFQESQVQRLVDHDPLAAIKQKAKIQLYEITRI